MKQKLTEVFNQTKNPKTNTSLLEENRLKSITQNKEEYNIIYHRDGLNPEEKNKLEDLLIQNFSEICDSNNIILNSISKQSTPAAAPTNQPKAAPPHQASGSKLPTKKRINGVKHIIAISSCKGGVGKSTVAVNLAFTLKQMGFSVGIMDADIYGPSLPTMLGKEDLKPQANEDNKILPFECDGVKFISFGHFVEKQDPVIWRGPMLGGVIKQFAFDTFWGELDYLLIDLPPGTGDVQLSISQLMDTDGAVVVSTPQQVALSDSIKGLKMFKKVNIPVLGMVENMSYFMPEPEKKYFIFGKRSVEEISKQLETPFLASIPIDLGLCEAAETQVPYMSKSENSQTSVGKIYLDFGKKIIDSFNTENQDSKKGFLNRLLK